MEIQVTIGQLLAQKEKNQAKEKEIKEKKAKIKAFKGLPPVSILSSGSLCIY